MVEPVFEHLSVDALLPGKYQPRQSFDQQQLSELAQSIKSSGLIQPVIVRRLANERYEIIAGERRWRATKLAGLTEVACLVNEYTDAESAQVATIENINRADLNPIEEAKAYQQLIELFDYTHDQVAAIVGKSRAKITNSLRLLNLDYRVKQWLIDGRLSEGYGKVLAGLAMESQYILAKRCLDSEWSIRQLVDQINQPSVNVEKGPRDPNLIDLEQRISEATGCQARIDFNGGNGTLHLNFYDFDVLDGILSKLGVSQS